MTDENKGFEASYQELLKSYQKERLIKLWVAPFLILFWVGFAVCKIIAWINVS